MKNARAANLLANGPALTAKDEAMALQVKKPEFQCSNRWLERFKKFHGMSSKTIVGESGTVNQDTVDIWRRNRLVGPLDQYADNDIYNANKAAVFFYKLLPKRTYTTAGGSSSGGKQSKERTTV